MTRIPAYVDALARVIYDAAPRTDARYALGQYETYAVSWDDVPEDEKEQARKRAQAVIDFVTQGAKQ